MAGTPAQNGNSAAGNSDFSRGVLDLWRTPQAGDCNRGPKSQRAAGYGYRDPAGKHSLVSEAATWPTPLTADDGRKVTIRSAQKQLCNVAEAWPSQPSRPDHPTVAGGRSSPERRTLNPLFVEWLMGWPSGLSGFERAETEFSRWLQRMRICLSTLSCARTTPTAQQRLL